VRIRFPIWWAVLAFLYLLLHLNTLFEESKNRIRWTSSGAEFPRSALGKVKEAYSHGGLLPALEFLAYFYAGMIVLVGLPTLIAIIIYSAKRKFDAVRGLLTGLAALMGVMLLMACFFEMFR
jgi:hypothetical protein